MPHQPYNSVPAHDPAAAREVLLARISAAAEAAGRESSEVTLTAVSKQQPNDRVDAVLAAGQTVFGENRVQEAKARWRTRRAGVELRLIGPLQSNKAVEAIDLFDVIETLDRPKLATALVQAAERSGRLPRLYVQVNTGEEPQKAGVAPAELDAFLKQVRGDYGLAVEGLMCIPPAQEPPALHFALLGKLAARSGLSRLSMGMSEDFETAVKFGATSVRIGSALFGHRSDRSAKVEEDV